MIIEDLRLFCRGIGAREMSLIISKKSFHQLELELDDIALLNTRSENIIEDELYIKVFKVIDVKVANCLIKLTNEEEISKELKGLEEDE